MEPPEGALEAGGALLVLDKPEGITSHDAVARVRRLYSTRRVGHAGTLDPSATGVLLVLLGRATRLAGFLQSLPKSYAARVAFGATTSTQDAAGEVVDRRPCSFDEAALLDAAASLTGRIMQVPPMVSAVKVDGERLYKKARRGEEVERAARPVTVYELAVESFAASEWAASIRVVCSSGTYVRTIAADLGEKLGCGGHLSYLRRTSIGSFGEAEAHALGALEGAGDEARRAALVSPKEAMRDFPAMQLDAEQALAVASGRRLDAPAGAPGYGAAVAMVGPEGELLAVYRNSGGVLSAAAVFN